jgi:hypothetical protein
MNNFAVLTTAQTIIAYGVRIIITTNNPCHLTSYYTDKQPGSHRTSRNQRGLTLPWGVYYCFVAWQSVEQIEPGDTLTHTFDILDWAYCQTKWFCFRGTVAGELSPSVSAIFQKHRQTPLPSLYQHYTINDDSGSPAYASRWLAQTFRTEKVHTIHSVKLKLSRYFTPGEVVVSIRATDATYPIGADLSSGSTDGATLPPLMDYEWREIILSPKVTLSDYTLYAIVVRLTNGSPFNCIYWRRDSTIRGYPIGAHCHSTDYGNTWSRFTGVDDMFEEWGTPP